MKDYVDGKRYPGGKAPRSLLPLPQTTVRDTTKYLTSHDFMLPFIDGDQIISISRSLSWKGAQSTLFYMKALILLPRASSTYL